jgi:hypothetical protein
VPDQERTGVFQSFQHLVEKVMEVKSKTLDIESRELDIKLSGLHRTQEDSDNRQPKKFQVPLPVPNREPDYSTLTRIAEHAQVNRWLTLQMCILFQSLLFVGWVNLFRGMVMDWSGSMDTTPSASHTSKGEGVAASKERAASASAPIALAPAAQGRDVAKTSRPVQGWPSKSGLQIWQIEAVMLWGICLVGFLTALIWAFLAWDYTNSLKLCRAKAVAYAKLYFKAGSDPIVEREEQLDDKGRKWYGFFANGGFVTVGIPSVLVISWMGLAAAVASVYTR